jgi:hypothetical protein
MNPVTINSSSVTLTGPNGTVYYPTWAGVVPNSNNQVFQLLFGNLTAPGTYILSVSSKARDQSGNPLAPYRGTCTLGGSTAFTAINPNAGQVNGAQPILSNSGALLGVTLSFSQPMNPATINSSSVTLTTPNGTVYYPTWAGVVPGSNNQSFQLLFGSFTTSGTYTLAVSSNARDQSGNPITPFRGKYTLGGSTAFAAGLGPRAQDLLSSASDLVASSLVMGDLVTACRLM